MRVPRLFWLLTAAGFALLLLCNYHWYYIYRTPYSSADEDAYGGIEFVPVQSYRSSSAAVSSSTAAAAGAAFTPTTSEPTAAANAIITDDIVKIINKALDNRGYYRK